MANIRIQLTKPQSSVMLAAAICRFVVLVAGRRFGKTFFALAWLISRAAMKPGSRNWYVAPTYTQAEMIAWTLLKQLVPPEMRAHVNETKLLIVLKNGSEIQLKGADKPDSLRGPGLWSLVLDEYADMDKDAFEEVFRPMLSDQEGSCIFIGTPKGFNHFYEKYHQALATDGWSAFQFTTIEGGNVTAKEVEEMRRDMDPRIFRQEMEASFENLAGRIYYNFDRKAHAAISLKDAGAADLLIGMDFNVDPMSAVVAQKAGKQCQVLREFVIPNSNTREMARVIKQHFPRRRYICMPDPSGKARKTSANVGETDFSILREEGFAVIAPDSAPAIVDRINNTNTLLLNGAGERNLLIDPSCKHLIKAYEGVTAKEGTNLPDKTLGLEHVSDAADYLIWSQFNVLTRNKLTSSRLTI